METEKNRLEMLLNNNLLKKLEQLQQELQEMRGEDRKQKLDMLESELKSVGDRLTFIYGQFSGMLDSLTLHVFHHSSCLVQLRIIYMLLNYILGDSLSEKSGNLELSGNVSTKVRKTYNDWKMYCCYC